MWEIKANGKYVQKFNNKFHKRQWVKDCFMYEEMIERAVAVGVTEKLLGNAEKSEFELQDYQVRRRY